MRYFIANVFLLLLLTPEGSSKLSKSTIRDISHNALDAHRWLVHRLTADFGPFQLSSVANSVTYKLTKRAPGPKACNLEPKQSPFSITGPGGNGGDGSGGDGGEQEGGTDGLISVSSTPTCGPSGATSTFTRQMTVRRYNFTHICF